jgi:hypothetical protein
LQIKFSDNLNSKPLQQAWEEGGKQKPLFQQNTLHLFFIIVFMYNPRCSNESICAFEILPESFQVGIFPKGDFTYTKRNAVLRSPDGFPD